MAFKRLPEVDPSLAISGLTLLAGTLAVLRVRRKK
jgi:LPXTG-motif cell wall-anchored protein